MSKHITKRHNRNLLLYHLVCPVKYRREVFNKEIETGLKNICLEIEQCYEIEYIEIGTDKDHVHFLIQCIPAISPSSFVQITKSITAKELFKQYPEVKKKLWGGKFWTRAYYINTVGQHGNENTIANYVKNQGMEYRQVHRRQLSLLPEFE